MIGHTSCTTPRAATRLAAAVATLVATGCSDSTGPDSSADAGAVYVLTNAATGNGVAVYTRAADGTLTAAGTVPTGGLGTGDLLDSQGALALSDDRRLLFAVNAGSDQITVFAVQAGALTHVQTVSSNGDRPVSLTLRGNRLYVLNSGSAGNVTGFTLGANGQLALIAGSTQGLGTSQFIPCASPPLMRRGGGDCNVASPAQVQFNPAGTALVVTERLLDRFGTYTVDAAGIAGARRSQASSGQTPFGFAFDAGGRMFVSEAFQDRPNLGAASSYAMAASGTLSVVTGKLANQQTASCWLVLAQGGGFAYVANPIAGTITGYRVAANGGLTLLDASGATATTGGDPRDMVVAGDHPFLYALNNRAGAVGGFRVNENGSLTALRGVGGFPPNAVGIAAY